MDENMITLTLLQNVIIKHLQQMQQMQQMQNLPQDLQGVDFQSDEFIGVVQTALQDMIHDIGNNIHNVNDNDNNVVSILIDKVIATQRERQQQQPQGNQNQLQTGGRGRRRTAKKNVKSRKMKRRN